MAEYLVLSVPDDKHFPCLYCERDTCVEVGCPHAPVVRTARPMEMVVRCKDCKYMQSYEHINKYCGAEWLWCYLPRFESPDGEPVPVEPDGFCSWAEPRAVD